VVPHSLLVCTLVTNSVAVVLLLLFLRQFLLLMKT
jgi:hypothetical protein